MNKLRKYECLAFGPGVFVRLTDYDALAAKAERYIQEGISLADQRDALAAECQRLREALTEVMHVMPCLPPAGKLIDGMSARYEAAVKIARTALVGNQGKQ